VPPHPASHRTRPPFGVRDDREDSDRGVADNGRAADTSTATTSWRSQSHYGANDGSHYRGSARRVLPSQRRTPARWTEEGVSDTSRSSTRLRPQGLADAIHHPSTHRGPRPARGQSRQWCEPIASPPATRRTALLPDDARTARSDPSTTRRRPLGRRRGLRRECPHGHLPDAAMAWGTTGRPTMAPQNRPRSRVPVRRFLTAPHSPGEPSMILGSSEADA
jgi:hypothetical protein